MRNISKQIKVYSLILVILFGALGQTACGPEQIEKKIGQFTRSIKTAREITTVQHTFDSITDEQYVSRLKLFKSLYKSIDVLGDKLVEFGEINSTNKVKALEYLRDVNTGLLQLLNTGDLGIKDEATKAKFSAALLTATAGLSSIELIIAAAKDPIPTKEVVIKAPVE
jgi:hypothetical protein